MKGVLLALVACLPIKMAYSQSHLAGCYVGLEEMCSVSDGGKKACYVDPAKPRQKWYHLTNIQIKGDSVEVAQDPIGIYKKDTLFSASDGAFYYYSGKIKLNGKMVSIDLTMTHCDYCGIPMDSVRRRKLEQKTLAGQICEEGMIINGYLFQPTTDTTHFVHWRP